MSRLEHYDIRIDNTLLLVIDIQEKLMPAIFEGSKLIDTGVKLIRAAKELELPIINTLQYPKGLGENVKEIEEALPDTALRFEKVKFSAYDDIKEELQKQGKKNILMIGSETHICLLQSVRDLLSAGYNVVAISDACSSRTEANRKNGFDIMRDMGAVVMSYESVLFNMLQDAKHPHFKFISNLVK